MLNWTVGSVRLMASVLVFCECVAATVRLACGMVLNVREYEMDELSVLLRLDPTLIWLADCLKYLLLPRLTDAENLEFGLDLASCECDH